MNNDFVFLKEEMVKFGEFGEPHYFAWYSVSKRLEDYNFTHDKYLKYLNNQFVVERYREEVDFMYGLRNVLYGFELNQALFIIEEIPK